MFTSLGRMIGFGAQNFWRNIWLSLITVVIVVLNLFLMTVVMGFSVVGQQTLAAVREKVNLSVFFTATTSEERVEEIRQELLKRPDVDAVNLITRAEHLDQLKKSGANNSGQVNAAIDALGENPLGAGLVVTAKTLGGYDTISKALQEPKYSTIIEDTGNDVASNQRVIDRLTTIVTRVQRITLWLTLLFALIAAMMVYNTLRVTIYAQREEIGIMKLVGASDAFVRGPFIITSLMYGLAASIITTVVLIPILSLSNPFFSQFFAGYDINILSYVQSHVGLILGLEVALGCGLSALSSIVAIGRYLRV